MRLERWSTEQDGPSGSGELGLWDVPVRHDATGRCTDAGREELSPPESALSLALASALASASASAFCRGRGATWGGREHLL
jgi:hypothetical protein